MKVFSSPVRASFSRSVRPGLRSREYRRLRRLLLAGMCGIAGAAGLQAANISFDRGPANTGTEWGVAENWLGDVLPSATDNAYFDTPSTTLTVSLDANREIYQLFFTGANTAYTIGSAGDVGSGHTLTLAHVKRNISAGGLQTIAANVALSADSSTWEVNAGSNNRLNVTGVISGTGKSLNKWGGGTLTLANANTFDGGVAVNFGTLALNFNDGLAPSSNIIAASNTLTIGGGILELTGKAGQSVTQAFAGTVLTAGKANFTIVNGSTTNTRTLLDLGAITREPGGTVAFTQPTGTGANSTVAANNGYTSSTANDASGILGAYATVGTEWATNNGDNIVAYTGYADLAGAGPSLSNSPTSNVRVTSGSTGDVSQGGGTTTINTLRVTDAAARVVTIGAANTLRFGAVGGVLATGTGGLTLGASGDAGTITAGGADDTAGELIIHNTTAVGINATVADNGTGAVALVKTGAGITTLNAATSHTGGTFVNQGTLTLAGGNNTLLADRQIVVAGGTGSGGVATLNLGGTTQDSSGVLIISGGAFNGSSVMVGGGVISNGVLNKTGSNIDARGGTISAQITGDAGIDKTTSGTFVFANTAHNTFTGTTTISEGTVRAGVGGNFIAVSGDLIVGTSGGGLAASYTAASDTVTFTKTRNLTVYENGSVNFGNAAQHVGDSGAGITVIGGTVSGSQVYQQSTVQMTGGTWGATTYGGNNSFTTHASATTSTISGNLNATAAKTFTVADGAAAVDLLVTGNIGGSSTSADVTKAGDGLMSVVGAKSYQGITTINGGIYQVDTLANAGVNSGLGNTTDLASRLVINSGTLRYVGAATSTDRNFTIQTGGATLDASGTGAVAFTNTAAIVLSGTNTARTLTLTGTNTDANTLAGILGNNGTGATTLDKNGVGTWVLDAVNTYTGATNVNDGRLALGASASIASGSALNIGSTAVFDVSAKSAYSIGTGGVAITIAGGSAGLFDAGSADLTLGNALTFNFSGSSFASSYDLFDFGSQTGDFSSITLTGSISGSLVLSEADTWTGVVGDYTFSFSEANGVLSVTAVPEPATFALLGGLGVLALACARRRRA